MIKKIWEQALTISLEVGILFGAVLLVSGTIICVDYLIHHWR